MRLYRRITGVAPGEVDLVAALAGLMFATAAGGAMGATATEALLFANSMLMYFGGLIGTRPAVTRS